MNYRPFGDTVNCDGDAERLSYLTEERDVENSYTQLGARTYDPTIGRFLSCDPLFESFPAWSPYHYCFNNPVGYKDPTGLKPEKEKGEKGNKVQIYKEGWVSDQEMQAMIYGIIMEAWESSCKFIDMLNKLDFEEGFGYFKAQIREHNEALRFGHGRGGSSGSGGSCVITFADIWGPCCYLDGGGRIGVGSPGGSSETKKSEEDATKCGNGISDAEKKDQLERNKAQDQSARFDLQLSLTYWTFKNLSDDHNAPNCIDWLTFADLVKTGAPFDLKYENTETGEFNSFSNTAVGGNYGLYNGECFALDDFGNFNFGVAAYAYGIPQYIARCGGGLYQVFSTGKDYDLMNWPGCGDQSRDSEMINRGYNYAKDHWK